MKLTVCTRSRCSHAWLNLNQLYRVRLGLCCCLGHCSEACTLVRSIMSIVLYALGALGANNGLTGGQLVITVSIRLSIAGDID